MAKSIYLWDERVTMAGWKPMTKAGDNNCMLLKVTAKEAMSNIIARVLNHVEPSGVEVLRILAHGYEMDMSGFPAVNGGGPGLGHGQLGAEGLNVNMVPKFAALKGKFAPGGRIELHSCKLADPRCTTKGNVRCSDWLQSLATAVGVKVVAAEQTQFADANWAWEGPTVTYNPK